MPGTVDERQELAKQLRFFADRLEGLGSEQVNPPKLDQSDSGNPPGSSEKKKLAVQMLKQNFG